MPMIDKEMTSGQLIHRILKPRTFGLGIVHIVFWVVFALVALDISRLTQQVVATEPHVFRSFDLKSGLGKPSGGNLISLLDNGRIAVVNMEQLRGQWTLVVFTLLSNQHALGSGSNSANDASAERLHHETLSASMSYLARHVQPRGVRLLLVQLDRHADLDFYKPQKRDDRLLSYVHTRPEEPWDFRLIAASKLQEHPRYYSWSYYPARVWLEREWLRRYYKNDWRTSLSPTREFTPMMSVPFYAILDASGELRWMGSDATAEDLVATLYKHIGIDKFSVPRAAHVLSPLYQSEHRAFGKLRINDTTASRTDIRRRFVGQSDGGCWACLVTTSAYLLSGIGQNELPARNAFDWQERDQLKVPVSDKLWMFPRQGGRENVLYKFYPDERKYPW